MVPNSSIGNETFENSYEDGEDNLESALLEMPLGVRIFWDLLFGSSIFISILGNVSVLWTIIGKSRNKSLLFSYFVTVFVT